MWIMYIRSISSVPMDRTSGERQLLRRPVPRTSQRLSASSWPSYPSETFRRLGESWHGMQTGGVGEQRMRGASPAGCTVGGLEIFLPYDGWENTVYPLKSEP